MGVLGRQSILHALGGPAFGAEGPHLISGPLTGLCTRDPSRPQLSRVLFSFSGALASATSQGSDLGTDGVAGAALLAPREIVPSGSEEKAAKPAGGDAPGQGYPEGLDPGFRVQHPGLSVGDVSTRSQGTLSPTT